jgi:hypothetical protein
MSITNSVYFNNVNSYLILEGNIQDGRLPLKLEKERNEEIEGGRGSERQCNLRMGKERNLLR